LNYSLTNKSYFFQKSNKFFYFCNIFKTVLVRYFVELAYKGSNYYGWQRQPNGISVQETLEKTFSTILNNEIRVVGAGRTDSGVHAAYMVAHFDVEEHIDNCEWLKNRLNRMLPKDIVIISINPVDTYAHSRFSAIARRYEYHLTFDKNPFLQEQAFYMNSKPDIKAMNDAAKILLHYCDYTSFCNLPTDVKNFRCTIKHAQWEIRGNRYVFVIEANRFLRRMVRTIVGTLLDVGKNKIDAQRFVMIIEAHNRSQAGQSAPAHGLYLVDVQYPKEIFCPTALKDSYLPFNWK